MASDNQHWNRIFSNTPAPQLGWYETDLSQTMKFLDQAGVNTESRVFIAGAGASKLADELAVLGCRLTVNDISDRALTILQDRLGTNGVEYLHHDLSVPLPKSFCTDYWVDRAVLHFLLDEQQIEVYFQNLRSVVAIGGHVLLAEFSTVGASRCAGLDVHRYSLEEMRSRLGEGFVLVSSEKYVFTNPAGQPRPYVYALFRRES